MAATEISAIEHALEKDFIERFPLEAAAHIERKGTQFITAVCARHAPATLAHLFEALSPASWSEVLEDLDETLVVDTFARVAPSRVAAILRVVDDSLRAQLVAALEPNLRADVELLLDCAPGTAGAVMDPRVIYVRRDQPVSLALQRLREQRFHERYIRAQRIVLVVDEEGRLDGIVAIQDLALAGPDELIDTYRQPAPAFVRLSASVDEIADALSEHMLSSLPVVDDDGYLVGVVRHEELVSVAQGKASADLQALFGASRDEKALSKPQFAVSKRLPWLQINLLTAFLAASVVGLFEHTIAAYTALAILLPVVAGQSGNTGAQALAVVIRGLALREISFAHWRRVLLKETLVGAINGIAVAVTCAVGVYVWSRSLGLTLVIGISMVLSMTIAGLAGAGIPLLLTKLGQDPAQSSSIVLTTVTDVAGFFSFLGIATLFLAML